MSIVNFYKDQEILVTGGTGFIGKVLIEKILRSLPTISKLYVLIRAKKNKTAEERLKDLLEIPVFRRVHQERPDALKKLIAISGDCCEVGLGISAQDMQRLRNVSIIFHVAATVRFDEDLKTSLLLNTRGAYEMVKLAQGLTNVKAFVHVSTTYAHPNITELEEKIYPPYADWRTMIKMAETYDVETLNILCRKIAPNHPNSYTFTKSLAEHIINDHRDKFPVVILRPSIVISSYEEPIPGWIDNFNGPMGMLVACGTGIMRTSYSNPNIHPDIIAVDMCAKALIVAAFKLGTRTAKIPDNHLEIYNCCHSSKRHLTTGDIIDLGKKNILKVPFEKCIWLPEGSMTSCWLWHYYRFITSQILPAIFFDSLLAVAGQKPLFFRLHRRLESTTDILKVFLNTEFSFLNDNFRALENIIQKPERSTFNFLGYCDCDMEEYYLNATRGAKEFLLKEKPEPSKGAHLRMRIFRVLHYTIQFMGAFYIARYLLRLLLGYVKSKTL
ncbi:fatty acyl-CoA reductase wat-like [Musca domestica]|uniref:Fatty acyl-CoA reductase n=2 Tax=Musca domestica TaxID=7370 RepID=A0ABM3UWL8_MUSDO|nr:fatty acyl-CoA reductase wat-like [Musca domestica]